MDCIDNKLTIDKLKKELNSPEYVNVPNLVSRGDDQGRYLVVDENSSKREGLIFDLEKKHKRLIKEELFKKKDWKEIVKLIKDRNKERSENYNIKWKQIENNLNEQFNLYYYDEKNKKTSFSWFAYPDKKGYYFVLYGKENNHAFYLNINKKHLALNDFPFQKPGYYMIETDKPIERNDVFGRPWSSRGENDPNNFHKWIEEGDKITITPYNEQINKISQAKTVDKLEISPIQSLSMKNDSTTSNIAEKLSSFMLISRLITVAAIALFLKTLLKTNH